MIAYEFDQGPGHLIRLATGDDVLNGITEYVTTNNIEAASLTFLGAVRKAALRYYDQEAKVYRDFELNEHFEVVAGVGNVSLLDGKPFVHIHCALADSEGRAFGGHVNVGMEVFALEVTVLELVGAPPVRELDDCTGLTLWGGELEAGS